MAQPATDLPVFPITVFAAPSQSVWLPLIIQGEGFDIANGFRLELTEKPSTVAYADFATGAIPTCFCAAPAAVARFVEQGSDVTLVFNIFNLDFAIVTDNEAITTPKDLEGRSLAADTATGSWAITSWLLQEHGVNLDAVDIQSSRNGTELLLADRIDATASGPIDVAIIESGSPGAFRAFSVFDAGIWSKYADTPGVPSIAFGAWRDWLAEPANLDLVRKLYAATSDAAAFLAANPQRAAEHVSAGTSIPKEALVYVFTRYPHIIDIRPSSEYGAAVGVLTQQLLPAAGQLDRPLTDQELDNYISDFTP